MPEKPTAFRQGLRITMAIITLGCFGVGVYANGIVGGLAMAFLPGILLALLFVNRAI